MQFYEYIILRTIRIFKIMFEISKVFLIKQQKNAILGINENSIKNFKRTLILAFRVFGNIVQGKRDISAH